MNKKELPLIIATITYLILLVMCLLMLFVCIPLEVTGIEYLIIIFMAVLIIGYLVVAVIRMHTYVYKCPHCESFNRMNFIEVLLSKRGNNERKLKCKTCKRTQYMERYLK